MERQTAAAVRLGFVGWDRKSGAQKGDLVYVYTGRYSGGGYGGGFGHNR